VLRAGRGQWHPWSYSNSLKGWPWTRALGEVYEDGPGWVQQFDGGTSGRPAVICAIFGRPAVAVDHGVWNALGQFGHGTPASGAAAGMLLVAEGLRVTETGRSQMLAAGVDRDH
jgi:hypothetical protein